VGPRKSEPVRPKPKTVEKSSRKSLADVESSIEPEALVKKRGRPKKDELPSDKMEIRDEDEDEHRAKKKPRKSNGLSRQDNKRDSDEEVVGNMKKHMKVPSWEELIETIDTVEREEDGELYVFFTLSVILSLSRLFLLTVVLAKATRSAYERTHVFAPKSSPRRFVFVCNCSTDVDYFCKPAHHVL